MEAAEHNDAVQVVQLPVDRLPGIEPHVRDLCGGRGLMFMLLGLVGNDGGSVPAPVAAFPPRTPAAPDEIIRTVGRFQYRLNFKDVWVADEPFSLRNHIKAMLCLKYLVNHEAFTAKTARHFLSEIDPYVRKHGGFIQLTEIKLKDYFREPTGRLAKLRLALVRSAGKNGKYFLETGAV